VDKVVDVVEMVLVDEDGAGKSKILAGSSSTNNLFIS